MSGLIRGRNFKRCLVGILVLFAMTGANPVLAQAARAPTAVTAAPAADGNVGYPEHSDIGQQPASEHNWLDQLLKSHSLPVLVTIIIVTTTLVAALLNVLVTPWTMRRIAADQREVADKAANAAVTSASAANENAKAAGKSAEAAVLNATAMTRNSVNLGVHQVATLRQEWINALRDELAALHSLLANWQLPETNADPALYDAHDSRVRDANTRLARVEMLLNPRELESRRLVSVLRFLAERPMALRLRHRRARWIVRWGRVVLKTEWDRVRAELNGSPVPSPRRRTRSGRVLSTTPFREQKVRLAPAAAPPSGAKKANTRRERPPPVAAD